MKTLILFAALFAARGAYADSRDSGDEAQLRAAFVYKLMRFANWPQSLEHSEPLVVCHAALNLESESALRKLESKAINNRELQVRKVATASQINGCHTLVLGENVPAVLTDPLPALGVLTIGNRDCLRIGGSVALTVENERMSMEFNEANLRRSKIDLPAQVLALGQRTP